MIYRELASILFISSFSDWFHIVVKAYLFGTLIDGLDLHLLVFPLLAFHLLPDLIEIPQCFLIVGGKSEGFLDFFKSIAEVILFAEIVTRLAKAQPRAMYILELFLSKLLARVRCSRARSGLLDLRHLSPSMKCLSVHCFS